MARKNQAADVGRVKIAPKPAKVRPLLQTVDRGHDFRVPAARNFRGSLFREVGNARRKIQPELRTEDGLHDRLVARDRPRCNAPSQSDAAAGRAGPLPRASPTHC